MPNIRALLPNEFRNRSCVPSYLHPKCSTEETEAESSDGSPSERQKLLLAPSIEIIKTPSSTPEDKVFFRYNNNVDDCPVSDDTQEGLEGSFREESSCATTDDDGGDEAECDEDYARDAESPRTEVLRVHGEGVVVWDVVLWHVSDGRGGGNRGRTGTELKAASTMRNLPNPPAGSKAIFKGPPTPYARYACFHSALACAPE